MTENTFPEPLDTLLQAVAALDDAGLDALIEFAAVEVERRRFAAFQADSASRIREMAAKAGLTVRLEGYVPEDAPAPAAEAPALIREVPPPAPVADKSRRPAAAARPAERPAKPKPVPARPKTPPAMDTDTAPKEAGAAPGPAKPAGPRLYRHPTYPGYPAWDGKGVKPAWLKKALEEGGKLEDFLSR